MTLAEPLHRGTPGPARSRMIPSARSYPLGVDRGETIVPLYPGDVPPRGDIPPGDRRAS